MERKEQRSKQDDLDAFEQERAERTGKMIVNLARYNDQLFAQGTSTVHGANVNPERMNSNFSSNF